MGAIRWWRANISAIRTVRRYQAILKVHKTHVVPVQGCPSCDAILLHNLNDEMGCEHDD